MFRSPPILYGLWGSLLAVAVLAFGCQTGGPADVAVTTSAVEEASANKAFDRHVRVDGTVTFSDPEWDLLFVQDESGGLFVDVEGVSRVPEPGRKVLMKGTVGASDDGIDSLEIEVRGAGSLPEPDTLSLEALSTSEHGSDWRE